MKSYRYSLINLPVTDPVLKENLITFATRAPGNTSRSYIESRLSIYKELVIASEGEQICAMQFIHSFVEAEKKYCYLGPLFSTGGAFFPMFVDWLQKMWMAREDGEIFLAAEFRNPELFLFFKTMFHAYSFPDAGTQPVPVKIRHAANVFARRIDHIKELNTENLSSICDEMISPWKARHETLSAWMLSRGVSISDGHAQVLIVNIPDSEKTNVIAGLGFFRDNRDTLKQKEKEVLTQFKEILEKNDNLFCAGKRG